MDTKNKIIISLLIFGALLFCTLQFIIIPANKAKEEQYAYEQLEATTQDVNYILPFKNEYMGNNSNTVNLFKKLPLATAEMKFQLFSESLTVQIDYNDSLLNAAAESLQRKKADRVNDDLCYTEVKKSLIYNSTAAFALINNLEHIIYHFTDVSYMVNRADVEALYHDFDDILNEMTWKHVVQNTLNDTNYLENTARELLKTINE